MKRQYSIYDVRTKIYDDSWSSPNDETAIRTLTTGVNKEGDHTLHQYPEDFALYYMGDFIPETGVTINEEIPILVRQCQAMVEQPFEMSNGVERLADRHTGHVESIESIRQRITANYEATK